MALLDAVIIPVTPFQQNATLLWCTKTRRGAFVDPGGEAARLIAVAADKGVTVERLLLTHGHLDHAGAAAALKEHYGVPIEGPHRDEDWLLERLGEQGARYGLSDCRPCTPDRWLDDGDTVRVGEVSFDVYHCPGHTPGHVVFVQPQARLAFVGDVLFRGSVGRTDFERGDHGALVSSIRTKLFPLGDDIQFVSGHGDMSTFGWERQCNPYVSDLAVGEA